MDAVEVPEWDGVRQAVQVALAVQPDTLDGLGRWPAIAVYKVHAPARRTLQVEAHGLLNHFNNLTLTTSTT